VLDAQPGVFESAVVGAPHADFGESVVGGSCSRKLAQSIDLDEIEAAVQPRSGGLQAPATVRYSSKHLPRNTMGKVQKNELRKDYADVFQPVAG
jgi:malonyl-CoA/methylmalonyl-CoA synthetase